MIYYRDRYTMVLDPDSGGVDSDLTLKKKKPEHGPDSPRIPTGFESAKPAKKTPWRLRNGWCAHNVRQAETKS